MRKTLLIALSFSGLFQLIFNSQTNAQTTRYVKQGASGDGTTWANASGDLQLMINASASNDMVWVAGGTYLPSRRADALSVITPNDRNNAFVLKKDVKIYGGFEGTETLLTQRDLTLAANSSTLSGDLGIVNNNSDNAYHVVISAGDAGTAELNGLSIKNGNANLSATISVNSMVLYQYSGGGIHNASSSPVLTNVTISSNSASLGGGLYNSSSSPTLTKVVISGNNGSIGGGIYNISSSPVLTNVSIIGNFGFQGGGIINENLSSPVLTNVTISANAGGAISNNLSTGKIRNSIIYGNSSGIFTNPNYPDIEYSLVQGVSGTTKGNIDGNTDPLFVTQLSPGLSSGGDYRLQDASPVINKGNDIYFTTGQTPDLSAITTDLDGNARKRGSIDFGAYENLSVPLPITLLNFTAKAEGDQTKLEWVTSLEMNNKEFLLSRSEDGVDFKELDRVVGSGNSNIKRGYVYYDNHPASGINYYRLQQRDFDGKIISHGIRTVQFSVPKDGIKTYPNPVKNAMVIKFSAGQFQQMELMDNNGKVLQRMALNGMENEKTLRMDNYSSGAYLVRFTGNGKEHVEKIVKE